MMSKERRTLLITTFICLCSLLVYISFTAVYPEPKTVQQNLYSNMLFVGGIVINVVLNIVLYTNCIFIIILTVLFYLSHFF